jgi:uncharacterized protein YfkK (UPF0435 family)
MAKSATERSREMRERERAALREVPDSTYPFLKTPFYQWADGTDWDDAEHGINAAGMNMPLLEDDSGPKSYDGEPERGASDDWHPYAGYQGSIGRAEAMIDHLLASLSQMTVAINIYKVEEITDRIAELEQADLSDRDAKKQALADIVRLVKMKEHLSKSVRVSLPQWKVKGI